ncbi:ADP-ribosylglycohydrolase family protein [Metabacillus dongyingensis]|uniref:ADP-ribosylglycohydrolase family protein n=1 Tax=Metabacillus dongyingensis TaxID=2874282 RepID=UPI003B8E0241
MKVLGMLYGMAVGDALGMPSELWSREKVKSYFGDITEFLDGPKENDVACNFTKGQFTDDTTQALLILDSLIENDFIPSEKLIAEKLIEWAVRTDAFENNILGPSSKAALLAIKEGENADILTRKALTNGAAMRIAPIGALFSTAQNKELSEYVFEVSRATHTSDVSIGGAAMIAYAVSASIEDKSWEQIIEGALNIYELASKKGAETFTASIPERLKLGIEFADLYQDDEETFTQKIYDVIGCGTMTSESVPAALAIAYYAKDPNRCALICANIGGDTDTIGAMATAICGAKYGYDAIRKDWIDTIDSENSVDLKNYAHFIELHKPQFKGV